MRALYINFQLYAMNYIRNNDLKPIRKNTFHSKLSPPIYTRKIPLKLYSSLSNHLPGHSTNRAIIRLYVIDARIARARRRSIEGTTLYRQKKKGRREGSKWRIITSASVCKHCASRDNSATRCAAVVSRGWRYLARLLFAERERESRYRIGSPLSI